MKKLELIEKWLVKARSDLRTASHMFEDVYPKEIGISCYHSQQAVEKACKLYHFVFSAIPGLKSN